MRCEEAIRRGGGGRGGVGESRLAIAVALAGGAILLASCGEPKRAAPVPPRPASGAAAAARYPVVIHRPAGPPRVAVGGPSGSSPGAGPGPSVACGTCHATREPNPATSRTEDLQAFHRGLVVRHGDLACLACHDRRDYDRLRLADGTAVPYPEVMVLCGQCHGPQARNYAHGAHGGMSGYWDLTRGPRRRNNCIDCHDPHAPAVPPMLPTFKPIDRFLSPPRAGADPR